VESHYVFADHTNGQAYGMMLCLSSVTHITYCD